ncbi:uncharacterized protein CTRU02_208051 [Colletotrichum truncatum]|uniref:Uncharacterized protein n=1 Tax=Colletotrichum truncatum TaxID=5467 RepID=A0ACC3YY77_COLTU
MGTTISVPIQPQSATTSSTSTRTTTSVTSFDINPTITSANTTRFIITSGSTTVTVVTTIEPPLKTTTKESFGIITTTPRGTNLASDSSSGTLSSASVSTSGKSVLTSASPSGSTDSFSASTSENISSALTSNTSDSSTATTTTSTSSSSPTNLKLTITITSSSSSSSITSTSSTSTSSTSASSTSASSTSTSPTSISSTSISSTSISSTSISSTSISSTSTSSTSSPTGPCSTLTSAYYLRGSNSGDFTVDGNFARLEPVFGSGYRVAFSTNYQNAQAFRFQPDCTFTTSDGSVLAMIGGNASLHYQYFFPSVAAATALINVNWEANICQRNDDNTLTCSAMNMSIFQITPGEPLLQLGDQNYGAQVTINLVPVPGTIF